MNERALSWWRAFYFFGFALLLLPPLRAAEPPPADVVPHAGLSAQEACAKATMPEGFKMHVFAAEPELVQPIAFCLDHRGRVWVAEGRTYPKRRGHPPGEGERPREPRSKPTPDQLKDIFNGLDRILVLEDTDGDHKADKTTVFLDKVNLISGLEVGIGGVWIGAAPYLLFVPVKDWDSPKPAGDPQILLDGWDYKADTHETLNTFTWGPDGWLYGCHGVFCPSHVGKPGVPDSERQWMDAGVWRYHPTRHVFEVFTEGGSNPWGIDFDEYGQLWAEMCVIPHLWHMIQGARLERQGGEHFPINAEETGRYPRGGRGKPVHPHIYDDIKTHGDHVHYAGDRGPHAGNARSDSAGGGHAHAGVMCYLGESWPDHYRGKLFIGNIHGQRINMDIPERRGSGFVGKHGKDFLNFNDTWSQTLNQLYDQDGSVFIIDWYDNNQCHHGREDGHDRSNGRIYKIVYKDQKVSRVDLAKMGDAELAKLVVSKNEFKSRHARRLLQERANSSLISTLRGLFESQSDTYTRLRALWALHVVGGLDVRTAIENIKSPDEWVRGWTLQLAFESEERLAEMIREAGELDLKADPDLNKLAESDPSPLVRLFIASAAQRAPSEEVKAQVVERLLKHSEDAGDHNLPLMLWFAMEPLVVNHPQESLVAALDTPLPKILNFTARRIAAIGSAEGRDLITEALGRTDDSKKHLDILTGFSAALKGQRAVTMPQRWSEAEAKLSRSPNSDVRLVTQMLSLTFGSSNALTGLREMLQDSSAPVGSRRAALDALVGAKDPNLPAILQRLLSGDLRGAVIRALGNYTDPKTPSALFERYGSFSTPEKRDALNVLASRPQYAEQLLQAVSSGTVPKKDLTAEVVRQLRTLKNAAIEKQMTEIYGTTREISADKKAEIERYRNIYRAGGSQPGSASPGRVVYNKVCAQCHILFDSGGKVGPDITGSARNDLNYVLETIIDPNAVMPNEYRASDVETKDGRNLVGIVKSQDDKAVTLQTANELVTIPRNEIATIRQSEISMMPEGLLQGLTDQEVRDLLYYLSRPGQVPLPVAGSLK